MLSPKPYSTTGFTKVLFNFYIIFQDRILSKNQGYPLGQRFSTFTGTQATIMWKKNLDLSNIRVHLT